MPSPPADLHPLTLRMLSELVLSAGPDVTESNVDRALTLATAHFMALERVDMRTLATEVGINRVTLYRWFGDREGLLGRVMWVLSQQCLEWLAAQDEPTLEHTLASVQSFMEITSAYPPLQRFMAAEPAVALRSMLEPTSPLVIALIDWARERLELVGIGGDGPSAEELAGVLVSMTSTYCWARVIAGGEADIDGAMRAVRVLLRA